MIPQGFLFRILLGEIGLGSGPGVGGAEEGRTSSQTVLQLDLRCRPPSGCFSKIEVNILRLFTLALKQRIAFQRLFNNLLQIDGA